MTTSIPTPTIATASAPQPIAASLGFRSWGGTFNDDRFAETEEWLNREVRWIMCTTDRKTGPGTMASTVRANIGAIPAAKRNRLNCVMTIPLAYGIATAKSLHGRDTIRAKLMRTAAGDHDAHYAAAATSLLQAGFKSVLVRLGHESNGAWYPWSAIDNAASYIAAYRHVVDVMRAAVPSGTVRLEFEYNLARANIDTVGAASYPGDAYVDVIGVDLYYRPNPMADQPFSTVWSNRLEPALESTRRMALSHEKPWSMAEWATENQDDEDFINRVADYLQTYPPVHHCYFGPPQPRYNLTNYPMAKAAFKRRFGGD